MSKTLSLILITLGCFCGPDLPGAEKQPLNVLFIASDDMRPELGCYGADHVRSPNLDRLAARGTTFLRAYCQQAVCSPSRSSLMTGLRPDTIRIWDLATHFRDNTPDVVTLSQHFKQHGYHAERLGKIYHTGHGNYDDKFSWSRSVKYPRASRYGPDGNAHLKRLLAEAKANGIDLKDTRLRPRGLPWEAPDIADNQLTDGKTTENAIKLLRELKDQPFFLAVGYLNPHLPFVAPKKYWDLYEPSSLKLADNPYAPQGAPNFAMTSWGELRKYHGIPERGALTDAQARSMIHGYYAAISYVDAQVGRLLDELNRLGLVENTIIVFWGDHGWKLGEHGGWCKHTNFELDARVPLIFSMPGQQAAGQTSDALVEFVDVYPTLCDLANLPLPNGLEGLSAAPLLDEPDLAWKRAAFSQYPRSSGGKRLMGYSMRTDRYRFTRWENRNDPDDVVAIEVYDHANDPAENVNIATDPANDGLVRELTQQYLKGWQGALPKSHVATE
ncbi:MAG: sulfatase [Planctomycetota bacterium]